MNLPLKLTLVVPEIKVADVRFNLTRMLKALPTTNLAYNQLVVFPELALTGKTCGDLFHQRAFEGESEVDAMMAHLKERLLSAFHASSTSTWPWFEASLTYCNARLPHALIVAGARMQDEAAVATGLRALEWLCSVQTVDGVFAPIGSNGFWVRGEKRAMFDQQPVEVAATISACLDTHRLTSDRVWVARAQQQFQWFLGQNQLEAPLFDPVSGGCRDGLH